jgi:secreted Zn-dependent insulinase-like peptidase
MYDDTARGHFVKIVPIKDLKTIEISWPQLPSTREYYDGNPLSYLSFCVGHEGENSLLSELKRQNLCISLSAGPSVRLQDAFAGFNINVSLTNKGAENVDEVIRLVFAYINNLKAKGSPPMHCHTENQTMNEIAWLNVTKGPAVGTARALARRLCGWKDDGSRRDVDIEDFLYKVYMKNEPRLEKVQEYLEMLTPDKAIFMQRAKSFSEESDLREEPIYKTMFKVDKIPEDKIEAWSRAMPLDGETLDYPPENIFVPKRIP